MSTEQIQLTMVKFLRNKGYKKITYNNYYIIAEGALPVTLVAHMDTVFNHLPQKIYYDPAETILWSPQGLGADDRAGVCAIIKLIELGFNPSIVLTNLEECGGIGANELIKDYPKCPFSDCKAIIELDRQGENDCVFYDCDNKKFEKLINSYGFETELGTFTDINIIAPQWKTAAVNLSVGYYNEHSPIETLNITQLKSTINKVAQMLKNCEGWNNYEYIQRVDFPFVWNKRCVICDKELKDNEGHLYSGFRLCDSCFQLYY